VPGSAAVATATGTATATASGSVSTPGIAAAGPTAATPVSAEGVSEPAEFPDGGAGTAPTVDIDDLAASISRPLAGGSGEYSVQVSLHPPELGEVRALLSLQGDVLHVTLTPEHASGYDALSDAMPALHEQLGGGGVEVNVTLGQPGDTQGEGGSRPAHAGPSTSGPSDDATPAVTPSAFPVHAGSPGRINLVL
jgi:flagellar hook-length control protein FliK